MTKGRHLGAGPSSSCAMARLKTVTHAVILCASVRVEMTWWSHADPCKASSADKSAVQRTIPVVRTADIKRRRYLANSVPEFWAVDFQRRTVEVWRAGAASGRCWPT